MTGISDSPQSNGPKFTPDFTPDFAPLLLAGAWLALWTLVFLAALWMDRNRAKRITPHKPTPTRARQ